MKKSFILLMVVVLALGLSTTFADSQITLSVVSNAPTGAWADALQTLCNNFTKENPDIKIDFSAQGGAYENNMKVKMAANDLPDVFATHGWAIARYGKYLLDLSKEPWANTVAPTIKPLITDKAGKLYVLPFDMDLSCFSYNADVFAKYGIQPPTTLDGLMAVCAQIKSKSKGTVTPIHIGGADNWTIGHYYDFLGGSLFLGPKNNDAEALLNGTVDWKKFDIISQRFLEMKQKGYLNTDVLTAKYDDTAKALASGKAAISVQPAWVLPEAKKNNPNFHGGFFPIPAVVKGDVPQFPGGEHATYGIWKNSKNIDAAKKFLIFCAKPENVKLVCEGTGCPSGITGAKPNLGDSTAYYEKYKDVRILPIWDRVYLPGGMWDVMCLGGQEILAGTMTPRQVSEKMESEYKRLRAAQK